MSIFKKVIDNQCSQN